jgi:hypothetical protein
LPAQELFSAKVNALGKRDIAFLFSAKQVPPIQAKQIL